MTEQTTYSVPVTSTGKGLHIPTELIGQYCDVLTEDGKEAVVFTTGDVFTATLVAGGSSSPLMIRIS